MKRQTKTYKKHYFRRFCIMAVIAIISVIGIDHLHAEIAKAAAPQELIIAPHASSVAPVSQVHTTPSSISTTVSAVPTPAPAPASTPTTSTSASLQSQIDAIIANYPDVTTSVSTVDLSSGAAATYGSSGAMIAASTTKVLTAAAYLSQVEAGQASLDQDIDGTAASDLIYGMLNQSNDTYWDELNDYLTYDSLQTYADNHGLSSYDSSTNSLSSADEASLLAQIYNHTLLNASDSNVILSAMQNTNNEDLIPPALPSGATVYDKWGEYDTSLHDAAIITYQGHSYVLVIYTSNDDELDYDTQQSVIQQIAQVVSAAESNG